MPTKNPRVNVTLPTPATDAISLIAKQEQLPVASIARELILEALERREDFYLSETASSRDIKAAKKVNHDDAWK